MKRKGVGKPPLRIRYAHSQTIPLYKRVQGGYTWGMERYNERNKFFARQNRRQRNATRQEGVLWHCYLKTCPVNFARQYRIGDYIVDFYAPSIKLVIELDGSQHYEPKNAQRERRRTEYLESLGITVLRFTNRDIDRFLKRTTEQIVYVIEQISGKSVY